MSTATPTQTALADIEANPRRGAVVQTVALLLTAAPVLVVSLWALATVF